MKSIITATSLMPQQPIWNIFYKRPIELFEDLAAYYEAEGLFEVSHSRMGRYDILRNFVCERKWGSLETFQELLISDLYLRENLKSRPSWSADPKVDKRFYMEFYNNEEDLRAYLTGYDGYDCKQIRKMTHVEHFTVDIKSRWNRGVQRLTIIIFCLITRIEIL